MKIEWIPKIKGSYMLYGSTCYIGGVVVKKMIKDDNGINPLHSEMSSVQI